jgi:hypothetical protein
MARQVVGELFATLLLATMAAAQTIYATHSGFSDNTGSPPSIR